MKKVVAKMKNMLKKRPAMEVERPSSHMPVTAQERDIVHKAVKRTAEEYGKTLELLAKT